MHIHVLGICGTFMGGIARLAKAAGHIVTGSDSNTYPPMSTQLEQLGIPILPIDSNDQFVDGIDQVIVGNVMSRGYPVIEQLLNIGLPYTSGPQWLAENILRDRHVLAVAGTHGKTTTASMLAWILERAGQKPGFLIGGVPQNFGQSARFGEGDCFVVEADEYDTAFFDKRSKFVHYRPSTLIINNLEFDHADIFDNLDQIKRQFHHLVRTVPGDGCVLFNADDKNVLETLELGCWSRHQSFSIANSDSDWHLANNSELVFNEQRFSDWNPPMPGAHNAANALAATAAAHDVGLDVSVILEYLAEFLGVARRLQLRGTVSGVEIYDDFAHHPTAIEATLSSVDHSQGRLIAVLEPRSNTMKRAVHVDRLADALQQADQVWLYRSNTLEWNAEDVVADLQHGVVFDDVEQLLSILPSQLRANDKVVIMSNGGFDDIHTRLINRLTP